MTPGRESNSRHRDILIAIRAITRAVELHSRSLRRYGLTGPQLILLEELHRAGEVPVGRVARTIQLSQATVTGILKRLVAKGLVHRRRSDCDRRQILVRTTDAGARLLAHRPPLLHEPFTRGFDELPEWEQGQLLASLQRMVMLMERRDESGAAGQSGEPELLAEPPAGGDPNFSDLIATGGRDD